MTTLFLSHVCDIPYDTYVRKPILFRDTLINVSSLMSFFFSQTVRQGNNVTHSLESKTFFSFGWRWFHQMLMLFFLLIF